jgi:hypothetical protein
MLKLVLSMPKTVICEVSTKSLLPPSDASADLYTRTGRKKKQFASKFEEIPPHQQRDGIPNRLAHQLS